MPTPKEMKISLEFDDGTRKECTYKLSPLRSGDNPHQAGFVGEPGNSYTEVIEGRGMGFTNHIDLAGYSVAVEIARTMAFLGDKKEITFNSIKDVSASFKEYTIFDLQNAVFQKDKAAALKIVFNLLEKGAEATLIISMLTKYFIGLSQVRELNEKKIPDAEAAKIVGTHPFYLKNFQRAAVLFTNYDLIKAMEALLKADVSIKTTSTDPKTVISILMGEIF